jgi:hypothetical protein
MRIIITTDKPISTLEHGRLPKDIPIDVNPLTAKQLIEMGVAVAVETKAPIVEPVEAAKPATRGRPRKA